MFWTILHGIATVFISRHALALENLALRHQLTVYQRSDVKPRIQPVDRVFWSWLSCIWSGWRDALVFVQPRTIIAWQGKRSRDHWARISGRTTPGRPSTSAEIRRLIRRMSKANPLWGSPKIVGELEKIGITIAKSTVEKYLVENKELAEEIRHKILLAKGIEN